MVVDLSRRAMMIGAALGAVALTGCQTTAETSADASRPTVQMARDAQGAPEATATAARGRAQQIAPRIYLIRGLANIFSLGMDDLAEKLRQRGYHATVHEYGNWRALADEILANQRATGGRHRAVVMGHSLGANVVADIADHVGRHGGTLALAVAFDPTVPRQVSGGAQRFVNLYQSNNGWGASLSAAPGYRGRLENIDLSRSNGLSHFNIEKDPRLHAQVIGWVAQAVGGPGRRAGRQAAAR